MAFVLLLLATSVTLLMPSAFWPELREVQFFLILILASLAASLPKVVDLLTTRSLAANPATACLLGLLLATALSHLSQLHIGDAKNAATEFAKVVVFYLVLVANIDTTERLSAYLSWLALTITVLAGCAILQYHGIANLSPELEPLLRARDYPDPVTGLPVITRQLRGVGFFADPNDICLALVTGIFISFYRLFDQDGGIFRIAWLGPLAILLTAFPLSESRGGLLGLAAGLLVFLVSRFGVRRTIPLTMLAVPALLMLAGGRQTEISTGGTAQSRIQLWSEGLIEWRRSPLFGIGSGMYADVVGQDAHNSYVHSLVELGLFGGAMFLGFFSHSAATLYRLGSPTVHLENDELRRLRPYLLGILSAYMGSIFSLSRVYVMPTYLIVGLSTAFFQVADPDPPVPRVSRQLVARLIVLTVVFVVGIHIYIRVFAQRGGG